MAEQRQSLARIPVGPVGRAARIMLGVAGFVWIAAEGVEGLGTTAFAVILFLALSLLIAGVNSVPGCEITALPNLFLREDEQLSIV